MNNTFYKVLLAITSILCICFAIFLLNPKRPIEYHLSVIEDDNIGLRDFYILDTDHYTYIPNMFYFENHSGRTIEKIILNLKSGNKDLFTLSAVLELYDNEKYYPYLGAIKKFNLSGSDKLVCELEYWFEGSKEPETFSEVVELIDTLK